MMAYEVMRETEKKGDKEQERKIRSFKSLK